MWSEAELWIHFCHPNLQADLANSIEQTQIAHKIILEVAQVAFYSEELNTEGDFFMCQKCALTMRKCKKKGQTS